DAIISHVRHEGVAASFRLGKYMELSTAQAAVGSSLLDLAGLIQKLALVSPSMEFKHTDLKTGEALKQFPGVKDKFTIAQQSELPKLLGEALLVVCAHCRRLVRDKKKFEEAASKLSLQQAQSLKELTQKIGAKRSERLNVEETGPEELEGLKKPAGANDGLSPDWSLPSAGQLTIMTYKTGAVALRVVGGRQLLQLKLPTVAASKAGILKIKNLLLPCERELLKK
ncbi:unnamed protein product, partial [Symbiodinium pilosum]